MTDREDKKKGIIYPESSYKQIWDLVITVNLLLTLVMTPFDLAFGSDTDDFMNTIIDVLFLLDILIIFNCAYYT